MSDWIGALLALLFLAFALGSRKLAGTILTGLMLFAGFGFLIGPQVLGWVEIQMSNSMQASSPRSRWWSCCLPNSEHRLQRVPACQ